MDGIPLQCAITGFWWQANECGYQVSEFRYLNREERVSFSACATDGSPGLHLPFRIVPPESWPHDRKMGHLLNSAHPETGDIWYCRFMEIETSEFG